MRVQLRPWLPLERAYAFIEEYLKNVGRPVQAFCGIEMRVPARLTFDQWSTFNVPYLEQLRKWGLMHGALSGVCRSNIALALHPPATTSVCAFSYTAPSSAPGATFCLSGTADIGPDGIIAEGDTSPPAMQKRDRYTIDVIGSSLEKLGFSWQDTTQIAIFHVHDIPTSGARRCSVWPARRVAVCSFIARGRRSRAARWSSKRAACGRS